MVEFKAIINDVKTGKSYNVTVSGHHANSLIGKNVGEIIDGIFVGLPGYKLKITGGSDSTYHISSSTVGFGLPSSVKTSTIRQLSIPVR